MPRMPAQRGKSRSRSVAETQRGKAVATPQTDRIGQLEAMLEAGSRTATLAQLAARLSSSPRMAAQRALATSIRNSPHAAAQRRQMETHSEYRPLASPGVVQAQSVVQRAAGQSGLENIKDAIHEGRGKAEGIAKDLFNTEVETRHDGRFETDTVNKIKLSAIVKGYGPEPAKRLAEKRPYTKSEILPNTEIGEGDSEYYIGSFSELDVPRELNHRFRFENTHRCDGTIIFKQNYRNPGLADFFASDVFQVQRDALRSRLLSEGRGLAPVTKLVRAGVISVSGQTWIDREGFSAGDLSLARLKSFLETENGKSSKYIAASMGKTIISGSVSGSSDNWSVTLILQAGSTREEATTAGRSDSHDAQHHGSNATAATALANTASGSGTQNAQETDVDKAARLFAEITHRFSASRDANIGNYQPYIDRMAQHLQKMREVPVDASLRIPYFMQAFETVNGALNRSSM